LFFPTTDEGIKARQAEVYDRMIANTSSYFTVVGAIISDEERGLGHSLTVYVPVGTGLNKALDAQIIFDHVEYTLASPHYASEFREFALARVAQTIGISAEGSVFIMDMSEANNMLRMANLLDALYPTAVTIALLMGGLFPGLIVMQSDREASIMRVLGTTKKRTRTMLVLEQEVLCCFELLFAAALLRVINGALTEDYMRFTSLYAALHLAICAAVSLTCAVIITRRRVLELLQVKE